MPYDPERHNRRSIRLRGFDYRTPGLYVVTICTQSRRHRFGHIEDDRMVLNPAGRMIQQSWDEIPGVYPELEIDAFVVMPNHIHGIVFILPQEADDFPIGTTFRVQNPATPVGAPPCGCPRTLTNVQDSSPYPKAIGQGHCASEPETGLSALGRPQGGAPTEDGGSLSPESAEVDETRKPEVLDANGTGESESPERLSLSNAMERFKSITTHRYGVGVREAGWTPYERKLWQRGFYDRIVRNECDLDKFRRYIEANPARWMEDPYRSAP